MSDATHATGPKGPTVAHYMNDSDPDSESFSSGHCGVVVSEWFTPPNAGRCDLTQATVLLSISRP